MKIHLKAVAVFMAVVTVFLSTADLSEALWKNQWSKLDFSGFEWAVKTGHMAPGNNFWNDSSDAVFVDKNGALHLKITKKGNQFYSSEVQLDESLGYGTYQFVVAGKSQVDKLDQNLVLGLFLYEDDEHELDIELSNWKVPGGYNISYSVQPYKTPGNLKTGTIDLNRKKDSVYTIQWFPNYIRFYGGQRKNNLVWKYTGQDNFKPGNEFLAINFWMIDQTPPSDGEEKEVIIKSVKFRPATKAQLRRK